MNKDTTSPTTLSTSAPAMTKEAPAFEPVHSNRWAQMINDWLVVPKALYFMLNFVIYSTHAFLMQYVMQAWSFQKNDFSWTYAAYVFNILGAFVFSRLADRTGNYRLILGGSVAAYCACISMLLFPIPATYPFVVRMGYYLFLNGAGSFFTAGTFPLVDSMVMSQLAANPKLSKELFGRQRLWGTFGHSLVGLIVHALAEHFGGGEDDPNFNVMFYVLIVSSLIFIAIVFFGIPRDLKITAHSHGHHGAHAKQETSPVAGPKPSAFTLLVSPSFSFFLLTVFVAGFIRCIITTYQSGFITEELHYAHGLVTSSIFVRVVPESLLYFFSKEVTQYCGIYWVLLIGHAAGVIRMFGYTMIVPGEPPVNKKVIVPTFAVRMAIYALECLKGANSSLVISSAARIASDMAPKGLASTAQGYVAGVWQGVSMGIAAAVGYFLVSFFKTNFKGFEIGQTFRVCSFVGAVCIVLIFVKFAFIDRVLLTRPSATKA